MSLHRKNRKKCEKFKLKSTDEDNNLTSENENISSNITPNENSYEKTAITRLKCRKLQLEITNLEIQTSLLTNSRKNILLHTDILKLKQEKLTNEIFELLKKTKNNEASCSFEQNKEIVGNAIPYNVKQNDIEMREKNTPYKQSDISISKNYTPRKVKHQDIEILNASPLRKQQNDVNKNTPRKVRLNDADMSTTLIKEEKDLTVSKEEHDSSHISQDIDIKFEPLDKTQRSPFILLIPDKSQDKAKRPKFFLQNIFDTEINEYFELVSENPFKILPISNDVVLKSDYIDLIKPIILEGLSKSDSRIITISLVTEPKLKQLIDSNNEQNIINLCEEPDVSMNTSENISKKRKNVRTESLKRSKIKENVSSKTTTEINYSVKMTQVTDVTMSACVDLNEEVIKIEDDD